MKDILAPELDVLFCGINPGLTSAAVGLPFATRGSRWWPALHRSGFTPRVLTPAEADQLPTWGLGLTTMVRRPTARAAELTRAELLAGAAELTERVRIWRPRWLAILGVTAFRAGYERPDATVGLQDLRIGETRLWVLPNPSGLNAHYPPQRLAEEFVRLRHAADLPDRSRTT
ncbi:G/U mismatch-specific DNA glycosylase [Nocardia ninae]|uniref:Mismatch-specific DNA-glycosylase n=1 Tax=Nocardia ninae NBRC 108245 TaxID=1210091 RepID=A0A511MGF7_9NOCA|nr:G/U mismatch-specific DNA glycosylase [Nocardia ninae]GEM39659.1 mismatch-specific DNA-glycosylase [Nocardia ninae NBRC 108245]